MLARLLPPNVRNGLGVSLGLLALLSGCRSQPHQDLYADKMASEIRVLEDQLYEADYENKVLRNRLERTIENCEPQPAGPKAALPKPPSPRPDPQTDSPDRSPLPPPRNPPRESSPEATLLPPPGAVPNGLDRLPAEDLPVPGDDALVPPDLDSLELPDIDIGEITPPPSKDAPPEPPLGQIPMPSTEAPQWAQPVALSINPTFSGGHNFDSDPAVDGVYLVIQFLDQEGNVVDVSGMDIDADMSVVLLDPNRSDDDPRLGRWDFQAEEIAKMRRDSVENSIHVAVRWGDKQPAGDNVAAVVRLSNGDIELEGKSELPLVGKGQIAGWVPRAGQPTTERK